MGLEQFHPDNEARAREAAEWNCRGAELETADDFDGAIEAYGKAIAIEPVNSDWHLNRGVVYLKKEHWTAAHYDLAHAEALGHSTHLLYQNLAYLYRSTGEYAAAVAALERLLEWDLPDADGIRDELAWCREMAAQKPEKMVRIVGLFGSTTMTFRTGWFMVAVWGGFIVAVWIVAFTLGLIQNPFGD